LYVSEIVLRRILSHQPPGVATVALSPIALAYMTFNAFRHAQTPEIQRLSYARALHAARDRFTPRYAHRHGESEVTRWFEEAGFKDIDVVDWRSMPRADHDDYRRNVGVRAMRAGRI
jgi:hypothetical protein